MVAASDCRHQNGNSKRESNYVNFFLEPIMIFNLHTVSYLDVYLVPVW